MPTEGVAKRGRPRKTFKACRKCRRQKMRCEGDNPCVRCKSLSITCLYDFLEPKRSSRGNAIQKRDRLERLEYLEAEPSAFRDYLLAGHPATGPTTAPRLDQSAPEREIQAQNSDEDDPGQFSRDWATKRQTTDSYALNIEDLDAPVTALHAMGPEVPRVQGLSNGRNFPWDSQQQNISLEPLVDEAEARNHFNSFMTSSNCFLPIFDPVYDSFDSLRHRSIFCLYVILEIGSRSMNESSVIDNTRQRYRNKVRRLAAETLFIGNPTLEDAQAMTLIAAYSERTWLAIGHATQIALLLNLQEAIPTLLRNSNNAVGDRQAHRNLWVSARTWLGILCIEWEIAAGTARRPRLERIDVEMLRQFALLPASNPSDFRIVSSMEMVMLRCQLQQKVEDYGNVSNVNMTQVWDINNQFDGWWSYWDGILANNGFPRISFQRVGLEISRGYAQIFIGCTLIRKLQVLSSKESLAFVDDSLPKSPAAEILSWVVSVVLKQLSSLAQSSAYKWHLKSAPSYNVLTLAFTCAFALKAAKAKPHLIEDSRLYALIKTALSTLQTHPHKIFYRVICLLLSMSKECQSVPAGEIPVHHIEPQAIGEQMGFSSMLDTSEHLSINPNPQNLSYPPPSQGVDLPDGSLSFGFQQVPNCRPNIETNWIFDGDSIGSFGLPENGDTSVFDFEFPTDVPNTNL